MAALLQWRPRRHAGRQAAAWPQLRGMQAASSERSSPRMAIFGVRANRSIRAGCRVAYLAQ
eukprot:SAG25_NODE_951_length_4609_cov_3.786427_2_plen_61_part_00